ncbi:hypothetical protein VTK26DRAFT_7056 [Humicola hyalothermophila]
MIVSLLLVSGSEGSSSIVLRSWSALQAGIWAETGDAIRFDKQTLVLADGCNCLLSSRPTHTRSFGGGNPVPVPGPPPSCLQTAPATEAEGIPRSYFVLTPSPLNASCAFAMEIHCRRHDPVLCHVREATQPFFGWVILRKKARNDRDMTGYLQL